MSDSLRPHGLYPTRLLCPWDFLGKNTGVGCHFLLQKIFLTQGLNSNLLCLLRSRQILCPLSCQEAQDAIEVVLIALWKKMELDKDS